MTTEISKTNNRQSLYPQAKTYKPVKIRYRHNIEQEALPTCLHYKSSQIIFSGNNQLRKRPACHLHTEHGNDKDLAWYGKILHCTELEFPYLPLKIGALTTWATCINNSILVLMLLKTSCAMLLSSEPAGTLIEPEAAKEGEILDIK